MPREVLPEEVLDEDVPEELLLDEELLDEEVLEELLFDEEEDVLSRLTVCVRPFSSVVLTVVRVVPLLLTRVSTVVPG